MKTIETFVGKKSKLHKLGGWDERARERREGGIVPLLSLSLNSYMQKYLLLVCSLFFLFACRGAEKKTTSAAPHVKTIMVQAAEAEDSLASFGTISYKNKVDVAAVVEGRVSELLCKESQVVHRGDVLARLENIQLDIRQRQARSSLESSKSSLHLAQARLWEGQLQVDARLLSLEKQQLSIATKEKEIAEAQRNLAKKEELLAVGGVTSEEIHSLHVNFDNLQASYQIMKKDFVMQSYGLRDEDLRAQNITVPSDAKAKRAALIALNTQTLQAEVEVAQRAVDAAETELNATEQLASELTIRAPVDGIVGEIAVSAGERMQVNAKMFTLIADGSLLVIFQLREADASRVLPNMAVSVKIDALPNYTITARVDTIAAIADPSSGTVTIKAAFEKNNRAIRPGMFARTKLLLGQKKKIIQIPESALVSHQDGRATVYIVAQKKVFTRELEIGDIEQGRCVVNSGIEEGQTIVDNPSPLLREAGDVEM